MTAFLSFMAKVYDAIVNPILLLLIVAAGAYFLWGLAQFVMNTDDAGAREEGKRKIIWGLIGLTIMVSVQAILDIVLGTFDIDTPDAIE